jgi:hypothetical protein
MAGRLENFLQSHVGESPKVSTAEYKWTPPYIYSGLYLEEAAPCIGEFWRSVDYTSYPCTQKRGYGEDRKYCEYHAQWHPQK